MIVENDERMHFKGCPSDRRYVRKFREFDDEQGKVRKRHKPSMIATALNVKKGTVMVRPFSVVQVSPKDSESRMSLKLKGVLQIANEKSNVLEHKLNGI